MTIHQLEFERLESTFGIVWRASIPGFRDYYAIMVERETGKTKTIDPRANKSYHLSVDEAKRWCQSDFEQRISTLTRSQTL
jgi:hypothetical protein